MMGFFTEHWLLWTAFFWVALTWLGIDGYRKHTVYPPTDYRPIRGLKAARVLVCISGTFLVMAGIHGLVSALVR